MFLKTIGDIKQHTFLERMRSLIKHNYIEGVKVENKRNKPILFHKSLEYKIINPDINWVSDKRQLELISPIYLLL